ncbi:inositol monophosphatase 1-like [Uloborus diversus]|uniref:inositol monophosphatase 1-like n=1 Tax=Uloborus diversus TaxID=327109 RepID=UPI0024092EA0|nr:inositol monophosphatase 1-like [Uloborus diversus]
MSAKVDIDKCYDVAVKLAQEAGEIVRFAINKKKNIETKQSNVDLVTETDKQVEDLLKKGFKEHFPDHCFIGEEGSTNIEFTDAPTWIVDPVDGTMNFVHSFPYTAISIGLTVDKEVILGVVYNAVLDQMYTGVKGRGAYCNGKKLETSKTKDLSQALILCELGSSREPEVMDQVFTNFSAIAWKAHGIRMMGSAALNMCAIASGHADGYFEYTLHCWDMAGAKIIVEEAGGIVIDPEEKPFNLMNRRLICASSPELAHSLSGELKHMQFPHD